MGPMLYLSPPEAAGIGYGVPSHFPAEKKILWQPHTLEIFWESFRILPEMGNNLKLFWKNIFEKFILENIFEKISDPPWPMKYILRVSRKRRKVGVFFKINFIFEILWE